MCFWCLMHCEDKQEQQQQQQPYDYVYVEHFTAKSALRALQLYDNLYWPPGSIFITPLFLNHSWKWPPGSIFITPLFLNHSWKWPPGSIFITPLFLNQSWKRIFFRGVRDTWYRNLFAFYVPRSIYEYIQELRITACRIMRARDVGTRWKMQRVLGTR